MQLVITLRKDVADRDEGSAIFDMVKQKLQEHPNIKVQGHVTNHFEGYTPEPPPQGD